MRKNWNDSDKKKHHTWGGITALNVNTQKLNKVFQPKIGLLPFLILATCVVFTLVASIMYYDYISKKNYEEFEKESQSLVDKIEKRLDHYGEVLQAARGLFAASKEVERDEWKTFIETQKIQERFPGIQGVGFQKRTIDKEMFLKDMEELRSLGLLNRDMPVIGPDGYYRYIFYLEPVNERNKKAYGYDMYSEPVRREAIERSRDYNTPALSGKVTLVQEITEQKQYGFLLYLPVYENGKPYGTIEDRNKYAIGQVYEPFRIGDFVNGIINDQYNNLDFCIYDSSKSDENLMFIHDALQLCEDYGYPSIHKTIETTNFGRTWVITFHRDISTSGFLDDIIIDLILSVGFSISAILFFIIKKIQSINRQKQEQEIESKLAEVQHRTEINHLEQINQLKTEFVSVISHELKTPLASIQGYAEILNMESKNLTEDQKGDISEIHKNARILSSIVNDLLDTQKLELHKLVLSKSQVDINKLIDGLIFGFKPTTTKKSILLENHINDKIILDCDESRFVQILNNLVKNAIESITHQNGVINVYAQRESDRVIFSVKDNGSGMSKQQMDNLFKKFYQSDTSMARKKGGSGLGLFISKELIELHGGKIWAESELGKGTTFYFSIPIEKNP